MIDPSWKEADIHMTAANSGTRAKFVLLPAAKPEKGRAGRLPATLAIPFQPRASRRELNWYDRFARNATVRNLLVQAALDLRDPLEQG
jgi:hypothetical protein